MNGSTVAIYGATGHTGGFVGRELEHRGFVVRRISRAMPSEPHVGPFSHKPGGAAAWMHATCDDPAALDAALEGAHAVINCAGPFLDTAPAVVEAALRAGAHYLDIAAEQRAVRQTLATYDREAADRGLVVLPAMAFYGGLADLLAGELCHGMRSVDEILIGVALDYWHPTAGTRRTGERNTARKVIVSEGRLVPLPASGAVRHWQFPQPFGDLTVTGVPLSEIITISRHIAAKRIETFMNDAPLQDLGRAATPPPTAADASGRSTQQFVMEAVASGDGMSRRIAAFGHDIYAVSAPMVVEACSRILSHPPTRGGSFAPAELFEAGNFLAALGADIRIGSIGQLQNDDR